MAKSAEAFRTISEVADWLDTPAHVLRFWESRFSQIKPVKRAGGRRYYRPQDMMLLGGIKKLLHDDGITIKGVQNILREKGVKHVQSLSQPVSVGVVIKKKTSPKTTSPTKTPSAEVQVRVNKGAKVKQTDTTITPTTQPSTEPLLLKETVDSPKQNAQKQEKEGANAIASNNLLDFVSPLPTKLKTIKQISDRDLQDLEALYYSLKMVRNNMKRTLART